MPGDGKNDRSLSDELTCASGSGDGRVTQPDKDAAADIVISYSRDDHAIAEALACDLRAAGYAVWWDFQLYGGDDFHEMIRRAIAKATAVIVIWSESAVASQWVRGEAPGFDHRRAPINFLPLHCEPVVNRDRLIAAIERKSAGARSRPNPLIDTSLASGDGGRTPIVPFAVGQERQTAQNRMRGVRIFKS